jgi:hypothetical protein
LDSPFFYACRLTPVCPANTKREGMSTLHLL